jgi:hypothetical protein
VVPKYLAARDVISKRDVLEAHTGVGSHTAAAFMDTLLRRLPFSIRVIQVDEVSGFQDSLQAECQRRGIKLFVLPPRCPKLNGHPEEAQSMHTEESHEVANTGLEIGELLQSLLEKRSLMLFDPARHQGTSLPGNSLRSINKKKERRTCH